MTKNFIPSIVSLTLVLSAAIIGLILLGLPLNYYAGLFFVVVLLALFMGKPLYFLLFLFFIRALLDNYLFAIRFMIAGVDIGLGGILSLFLIGGTALYIVTHTQYLGRLRQGIVVLFFLFCLMSVGSALITTNPTASVKELIPRFSIFSVLIVVLLTVQNERDARLVLKTIVFSAFIPVVYGFIKYLAEHGERFQGTFAHPNIMAFYLLIILGCLVIQVHREEGKRWSFWSFFYFSLLLAALLLTLTRSAWASFFLMSGVYVLIFKRKWFFPALIIMMLVALVPVVRERLSDLFLSRQGSYVVNKESSLGWRLNVWKYLWEVAIKKPFFGYGLNATKLATAYPTEAHNDFLRFFLESGVVGVALYFGFYLYPLVHAVKRFARYRPESSLQKLAIFLICFVPAFFLMSLTENLARYTTVHWYIMGLLGAYFALDAVKEAPVDHVSHA